MTPKRPHALIRRIKDITISSALSVALLSAPAFLQSCSDEEQDAPGIRTYISETADGFKIMKEEIADDGEFLAYVTYLNGTTDTLTADKARLIVEFENPDLIRNDSLNKLSVGDSLQRGITEPENTSFGSHAYTSVSSNVTTIGAGTALSSALFFGGMGYVIGRSADRQYDEGRLSRVYHSSSVYHAATSTHSTVRSYHSSSPGSSRSGFFGRAGGRSSSS